MLNLRVLEPLKDEKYFLAAWEWQFSKPKSWQELFAIWTETKDEFLAKRFDSSQVDVGIFSDKEFIGLITLNETFPTVFEVHFDCDRNAPRDVLIEAILTTRDHVFSKGATKLFVFVAPQNRATQKLILDVGFRPSNIEILFGQLRGKVVHWKQYAMLPEEY